MVIKRARKFVAIVLSAALLLLAPGGEATRAFAAVIGAPEISPLSNGGVLAAPLSAMSPTASALGSPVSLSAAALAPGVSALAPLAAAAPAPAAAALSAAALPAALIPAAADGPSLKPAAPAAARPDAVAPVESAFGYEVHRRLLRLVSALSGGLHSLRPAGDDLTQRNVDAAADSRAVFSDFDETLADSNAAFSNGLEPETISAIQAVKAAGKTVDVISDRPESVFKSLSGLPVAARAGMYVAVDAGGKVYRYDAAGEPVLVYEAPAMSASVKDVLAKAGDATVKRLSEVGAELVAPTAADPDAQVWRPYTYTIRLKPGSTWEQVRGAGAILQEEIAKNDGALTVRARMAKDPSNPPYLVVSVNTKANASRFIARARGLAPKDIVILGDGMYAPSAAAKPWLSRFGERVSGRSLPDQGNGNDAEMEKGVPGARAYSVGGSGDPRRRGLVVLGKSGPAASREVLLAVASKPIPEAASSENIGAWHRLFHGVALWFESFQHYFIEVNVDNWREYRKARAASPVVQAGGATVSDADARGFFVDSRMMGMIGGARTVGSRSGSDQYVAERSRGVFSRYFRTADAEAREAFEGFLGRAQLYNPMRSSSNLRKQIRKALHAASLLAPDQLKAHFEKLMPAEVNDGAIAFQIDGQDRVLNEFRAAVVDAVDAESAAASDRVVGVVLLGSFAIGSATPTSDFDLHVLTQNGGSGRVRAFLERLTKRWAMNPESKTHPLNGADFAFMPSRELLLSIHHDKFRVLSPDERLERNLSPPADRYADTSRPDGQTFLQRVEWKIYNAVLRAATRLDDVKQSAAGRPVESLDAATRKRATIGWLVGRSFYLTGFVLAGVIAYPLLAQALVGAQGYTDLMSLGAVAAILLAPMSGILVDRLSFRNTFAFNNVIRTAATLAIPALVFFHAAGFLPLLAVALVTSWNVASSLVAEDKLMPVLAGSDPKRLSVLNAAANINFIGLNVLLGTFLVAGRWVDGLVHTLGAMPGLGGMFVISAALGAVGSLIQWATIPNVSVRKPQAADAAAPKSSNRRSFAIWSGVLAVGGALFAVLHPIVPQFAALPFVGAALIGLLATSEGFTKLWKNPVLRTGSLLSMAYSFVVYPVQSILIPFAARELNGGGQLQGQLQGSLFFGQLLAGSTMLKLPGRWNMAVRGILLAALGAWLGLYLFPSSLLMAGAGMAVAGSLYAVSSFLTDRGWMKTAFVGLSALALPLAFWGNIPALLLGVLILGLVNAPNKITIDTVVQREAKLDAANTGRLLGLRAALSSIAAAFGYASFGAITHAFQPMFPSALWPMLGMFAVIGGLLWMAPRWLGNRVAAKNFARIDDAAAAAPTAPASPREYSREELAQAVAARVLNGGVRAIITDYDGTLMDKTPDDKAVPASEELTGLLARLRRHGVTVVVSTNHFFTGDHNGMTSLLGERLDQPTRAGMFFAVQSGARIYEYGADGSIPKDPLWKETSFDDVERAKITPVFEAAALKVGLKPGDWKIYHEDSRSLIELTNHHELDAALYAELAKQNGEHGFNYLVQLKPMPTMRHVPYVQYFKAHKGTGASKAVEILKSKGLIDDESQALIFGDDFKPEGNDLYMAQSLPRALAVSVGKTADARQPNVMQSAARGSAEIRALIARLNEILDEKAAGK
jgi:hydroxymethylpyrimidine pyrophosphatase-like HAD family hydrolase/predicted nucleotidyltransferase